MTDKLKYGGIYKARVEYNYDPKELCRVKVRVFDIHPLDIPIDMLPWAMPGLERSWGEDAGSFEPPPNGSIVWVMFDNEDKEMPVYLGGFPGVVNNYLMGVPRDEPDLPGSWRGNGHEVPKDVESGMRELPPRRGYQRREPTTRVLRKSVKGHTISYGDMEGKEFLSFTDRLGQLLKFYAPSRSDAPRRGTSSADKGTQLTYSSVVGKAVILLKSISGSFIRFVSEQFKEKLEFLSSDVSRSRNAYVKLSSAQGSVSSLVLSEDKSTGSVVYLDADASKGSLTLRVVQGGVAQSEIRLSGSSVSVRAEGSVTTISPSITSVQEPPNIGGDSTRFVDTKDEDSING